MRQQQYRQNRLRYQYSFTEKQMRRYFFKPSKVYFRLIWWGAGALLPGIALVLIPKLVEGTTGSPYAIPGAASPVLGIPLALAVIVMLIGVGLLAGGLIPLSIHYSQRPSDKQYETWVAERLGPLYHAALQRLHLHESQCESITKVQGGISSLSQLAKKFPEKEVVVKRNPDGSRHYSINVCTYILLTKDDLAIYSGYINAFMQNERFEDADHYYYKDIVSVGTSGPIYTCSDEFNPQKEVQMQGMLVRIKNGEVVGTDYATNVMLQSKTGEVVKSVDKIVAALLQLIRDHKVSETEALMVSKDLS